MHGETLIQLIVPEGLMLRKFSQVRPRVQSPGNLPKTNHQPHAGSIRKEHVAKTKTMRMVGRLTYMIVPCVLKKVSVILKPSSVVCKQSHVDNVRIRVSTSDMHSKHIDTHCGYENKDGMVVSIYFTENKFSLLENDSSSHSVDNNGERYDNKVDICNVCDSISTASRKVGQKPYSVTEKCNTNNVVSHIGKSHHKVVPASVVHCNTSSSQTSVTSDSKYGLSLSGHPNNRARINNAISNSTFKLWDGQNSQKFGFIPTRDLIIPSNNK